MWKTPIPALLMLGTMLAIRPTVALTAGSAVAVLAEVRAALDSGDAAHARRLVEDGLKEPGLEPVQRARLLLDRGLASELLGTHDQALVDFTAAINVHALPAAEQAQGPPTNPVEMGLPDIACAVYRASQRPYRAMFESVWGPQSFAIGWPADVEDVCNRPGPPKAGDPLPAHLSPLDRGRAGTTGTSISFAGEDDAFALPPIEELLGCKINCEMPPTELLKPVPRKH